MSSWEPFPSAPEGCCTVAKKSSPRSSSRGNPLAIRCTGINANQTRCLQWSADARVQEASLSFTLGHRLRSREWQQQQWPRNSPSPPATLGRVQLTVAFQRQCTSAPAAPLLSSGLARGNSEKPALEAYLQDTKHGSVSPGPRLRAPLARPVPAAAAAPLRHRASREGLLAAQLIPQLAPAKRNAFVFVLRGSWRDAWCPEWKGFVVCRRFLHHNPRGPRVLTRWAGQEMLVRDTNRATATSASV